ncbi:MAG TPA: hypothetical protein VFS40_08265 [Gemmatimonadales bacterium]|nr:hypothetical protein [Gemmatimonadales bacterium]
MNIRDALQTHPALRPTVYCRSSAPTRVPPECRGLRLELRETVRP